MAFGLAKLKQDFTKHKAKAAVLSTLSLIMAVLVVKGIFEMMPRSATAAQALGESTATQSDNSLTSVPVESEESIQQGRQLWRLLRERRGIGPDVAFTFDATYFPPDPNRRIVPDTDHHIDQSPEQNPARPVTNEEAERRRKAAAIEAEAQSLIVRSTVVGGSKPVAVINDRILSVGDRILGFEVVAIRAREVEFKKDDVTLAVKMAGDAHSQ